jgi:hypothetical protein
MISTMSASLLTALLQAHTLAGYADLQRGLARAPACAPADRIQRARSCPRDRLDRHDIRESMGPEP